MTQEESAIVDFMKGNPESVFSRKEIARKALRRRVFEENPRWADEALDALVAREVVEIDQGGFYQLKKRHV